MNLTISDELYLHPPQHYQIHTLHRENTHKYTLLTLENTTGKKLSLEEAEKIGRALREQFSTIAADPGLTPTLKGNLTAHVHTIEQVILNYNQSVRDSNWIAFFTVVLLVLTLGLYNLRENLIRPTISQALPPGFYAESASEASNFDRVNFDLVHADGVYLTSWFKLEKNALAVLSEKKFEDLTNTEAFLLKSLKELKLTERERCPTFHGFTLISQYDRELVPADAGYLDLLKGFRDHRLDQLTYLSPMNSQQLNLTEKTPVGEQHPHTTPARVMHESYQGDSFGAIDSFFYPFEASRTIEMSQQIKSPSPEFALAAQLSTSLVKHRLGVFRDELIAEKNDTQRLTLLGKFLNAEVAVGDQLPKFFDLLLPWSKLYAEDFDNEIDKICGEIKENINSWLPKFIQSKQGIADASAPSVTFLDGDEGSDDDHEITGTAEKAKFDTLFRELALVVQLSQAKQNFFRAGSFPIVVGTASQEGDETFREVFFTSPDKVEVLKNYLAAEGRECGVLTFDHLRFAGDFALYQECLAFPFSQGDDVPSGGWALEFQGNDQAEDRRDYVFVPRDGDVIVED